MKGERTARQELELVLTPAMAVEVIKHRDKIKKPMTALAARKLANQFGKCRDPNAAAETMIEKGWRGFEPDWIAASAVPVSATYETPRDRERRVARESRPEPSQGERERVAARMADLSNRLAASLSMDKPRRVMPRGIR